MNKKTWKVLGAGGLALFISLGTLCGVLLAPMNSVHANTSAGDTSQTLSAEEKLVAGQGLGLDPENDPVIYTTESGLEIKFGAANLSSGVLSGYTYITFNSINWVIIGRSSSGFLGTTIAGLGWHLTGLAGSSTVTSWINNYYDKSTAAGIAINNDGILSDPIVAGTQLVLSSKEIVTGEIPTGSVLCISENNVGNDVAFGNTTDYANSSCTLRTHMESYFNNNFPASIKAMTQCQTIKQAYYNGSQKLSSTSAYLFPLAIGKSAGGNWGSQNFCIETYLTSDKYNKSGCYSYSRSGSTYSINGIYYFTSNNYNVVANSNTMGVRPAFVLKIT